MANKRTSGHPFPWGILYAVSGFSSLALETLWMREVSLDAGSTVVAAALVIGTFFLAAGLGSLLGARLAERNSRPLRLYACFEIGAALAALATFTLNHWLWTHLSLHVFVSSILLVAPPSLLTGVAFPLLAEAFVSRPDQRISQGGIFYGANLLAAAAGILAGSVWLPWWLGIKGAFLSAIFLQATAGCIAFYMARDSLGLTKNRTNIPAQPGRFSDWMGRCLLVFSGVFSLAVEGLLLLWARQVMQGSVYAISSVLCAFIGGLGLGALLVAFLRRRGARPKSVLLYLVSFSGLLLFVTPTLGRWLIDCRFQLSGTTPVIMSVHALGWSLLALLPLTICLGGVFPLAWELIHDGSSHQGRVLGHSLALNKLGAALGMLVASFVLLPFFGLDNATYFVGWSYTLLAVGLLAWAQEWRGRRFAVLSVVIVAVVGLWRTIPPGPTLGLDAANREIATYHSSYGPVSVVENRGTQSRSLLLNSQQRLNGTGHALLSQLHQGWVPLLFARRCDRVITIGMASGISTAAVLDFPVTELRAFELVPQVVRAAHEHFAPWNSRLFSDPRVKIETGDGRVLLKQAPRSSDVIICDLLFPSEDSTANLYSREFFENAREQLTPGGIFCLWLPCYQHDAESAAVVIRTFVNVFPHAIAVRANLDPVQPVIGLIGSGQTIPMSRSFLARRLESVEGRRIALQSEFFRSPENAWLLLAGDLRAAQPEFEAGPLTTDNRPIFAYLGPRSSGARSLVGMTFLNWIGRRFVRPLYPSCELEETPPGEVLASVRAAHHYFAAAVAESQIPGDRRSDSVRETQIATLFAKAKELNPKVTLSLESLGR